MSLCWPCRQTMGGGSLRSNTPARDWTQRRAAWPLLMEGDGSRQVRHGVLGTQRGLPCCMSLPVDADRTSTSTPGALSTSRAHLLESATLCECKERCGTYQSAVCFFPEILGWSWGRTFQEVGRKLAARARARRGVLQGNAMGREGGCVAL